MKRAVGQVIGAKRAERIGTVTKGMCILPVCVSASFLIGCGCPSNLPWYYEGPPPRPGSAVLTDRAIVIAQDGQLLLDSRRLTESQLTRLIQARLENRGPSEPSSRDLIVVLAPHVDAPDARVREIEELIRKHGGIPASRFRAKENPTTN